MNDYHARKAERTSRYASQTGLKIVVCGACNGTGRYDHNGSPACGCCGGTGKVREEPPTQPTSSTSWREKLAGDVAIKNARRR